MAMIMAQAAGLPSRLGYNRRVAAHVGHALRVRVTAIIAAGGRGARLGADRPKQLLEIGGVPILQRSVEAFLRHSGIADVVVALPADVLADPPPYLRSTAKPVVLVEGGMRRQDSVALAFARVPPSTSIVLVHDAARPFVDASLISRTIEAAARHGAALAAVPVADTVKRTGGDGRVLETVPRDGLFLAQTPQGFRVEVLRAALADTGDATDEATLAERAGWPVTVVRGDARNVKITTGGDIALAEQFVRAESRAASVSSSRIGTGYDLHRLVEGRPLILGGVTIPYDRGLLGHSDADIVCHAVTDAILGAAALGDIGRHFPDTDPAWKGADSVKLLTQARALVAAEGWFVTNVDVTVIAQRPKLLPYIDQIRANLAAALGCETGQVSVKGKTNEGMDATGAGEAMAAHAVALLSR
jgi:2-C-methyl-D-erythritol 4-phosphate cytidylyltransferase/2-C-methyl-D-erythritol 2,4-cyclodiphosphate synthase